MFLLRAVHIDPLTAFGLVAVGSMLVFYAMEGRSRHYTLLFAGACALGSAYGFMQGAWPFGLVEGIWSLVALRKWWKLGANPTRAKGKDHEPADPVEALLDDLLLGATQAGPATYAFPDENGKPCGYLQLYRPRPGRLLIHRIWTIRPRAGVGSRMMQTLCELADHHGAEIALRPLPFGPKPFPMSTEQLRQWYHRHGFTGPPKSMLRKPNVPVGCCHD